MKIYLDFNVCRRSTDRLYTNIGRNPYLLDSPPSYWVRGGASVSGGSRRIPRLISYHFHGLEALVEARLHRLEANIPPYPWKYEEAWF